MNSLKILLTSVLVIGFIIPGCDPGKNCDCGDVKPYFEVLGLTAELIQANVASVQWQDFQGNMDLISTYYGDLNVEEDKFFTFSLIPTAAACSCLPNGYEGSEVGIETLSFITTYDYNVDYPAGSDIAEILEFSNWGSEYKSYQDYTTENEDIILFEMQNFRLKQAPDTNNTPLQLTIRLVLDDGQNFEFMTEGINLML
ncbi:MAG: hypothetical protein AB8G11_25115 [Saprospiraceae bacterium]